MHEISLVAELIEVCLQRAAQAQRPVVAVRVRHASTVPAEGLRQAFEALTRDTALAGARLRAQPVQRRLHCAGCGFDGVLGHDDVIGALAVCPGCAAVIAQPGEVDLELLGVDLADPA